MPVKIINYDLLFEVTDVLGKKIRTTRSYWQKIKTIKHQELHYGIRDVKLTLTNPDEVRQSVKDETIIIFAKTMEKYDILIVAVKVLNGEGFMVTAYQTKEYKRKGEKIWPKQKE